MSAIDPLARTDGLEPLALAALIERFEARGRHRGSPGLVAIDWLRHR